MVNLKIIKNIYFSLVAHMQRRGDNIHSQINVSNTTNVREKKFLFSISGKIEWESPPNILVTRNLNWSQRSSTGTVCVKGNVLAPQICPT